MCNLTKVTTLLPQQQHSRAPAGTGTVSGAANV
jgi:hypothetical protein